LPEAVMGVTASAAGFFGPQDRNIPGLRKTIPHLDDVLRSIAINGHRIINREMESSIMFHLAALMGYHAATVCVGLKNRVTGEDCIPRLQPLVERATEGALAALFTNYQAKGAG
jgi:uridine phosphorylase